MNSLIVPSHWPDVARGALLKLMATAREGCGSCVHAGWGSRPADGDDAFSVCDENDFRLVTCAQGAASRDKDGGLEVLQFCTRWNGVASASEPPPIPESMSAGGARFSVARPGLIPPAAQK